MGPVPGTSGCQANSSEGAALVRCPCGTVPRRTEAEFTEATVVGPDHGLSPGDIEPGPMAGLAVPPTRRCTPTTPCGPRPGEGGTGRGLGLLAGVKRGSRCRQIIRRSLARSRRRHGSKGRVLPRPLLTSQSWRRSRGRFAPNSTPFVPSTPMSTGAIAFCGTVMTNRWRPLARPRSMPSSPIWLSIGGGTEHTERGAECAGILLPRGTRQAAG